MDIAIVSPSPKPFAMGGIEKLMSGLYHHIDEQTNHRVELFKIPTEENGFWELIWSYKTFYELDLNHFDKIITCKYPAWMVQHKNHTIYMAHHLRGLFDTYHMLNMPTEVQKSSYPLVNEILNYIQDKQNMTNSLVRFFELLNELHKNKEQLPQDLFAFPGPFIRKLVHFMDKWALHPLRIKKYASISETVKKRKDYFPKGEDVHVIYPPTSLSNLQSGSYDYFLVVGRLDGAKRVDLVINAMKEVDNNDARLLIAGTGPDEARLKALANGDKRIEFIGYINNEKLKSLYADALAIIYVPYDEDYGLVTIEAMFCGKPVITCKDSGGTTEFVVDNKTGLLADNNSKDLAKKMKLLADNKALALNLGNEARKQIQKVNWNNCITNLLSEVNSSEVNAIKKVISKKMIVLSTYPVFPRKHGGQIRIFNIYKNLSSYYDVTIISLNNESNYYEKKFGGLTEISVPMSSKHLEQEWEIEREIGIPITDIVMQQLLKYSPDYVQLVEKYISQSDILVCAQPYLFSLIKSYSGHKTIIYDSQNVEYELKKSMLPDNKAAKKLLNSLYELEKQACSLSDIVIACSEEDRKKIMELYQVSNEKMILAANGVDVEENAYVNYENRQDNKFKLDINDEKIIVFIGSWHKPNLEAVEEIIKLAPQLPDFKFIIMGGQCLAFKDIKPPRNLVFAGMVSEEMKKLIYSVADIAINPMLAGSGTNLKIAEYMANGVPVISTAIGARGYNVDSGVHIIINNMANMADSIRELFNNKKLMSDLSIRAREVIVKQYSWEVASLSILDILNNGGKKVVSLTEAVE
ncbi:Glycosyl transferases group 1 [Paenibacillus algorifonticola]|uniref:Glycosyl transferases group 1 n=1 Tax=Paenibacillus algorifonticola TaxID=684063 RepID=A0A1I2E038_9BACL|nr:glycosyltransferase family 4 protein [Paenibacillus algorifonticola]SFE86205.1 Glycosyl transferases group 1 [Paenibacillus algorifonticola]